MSFWSMSDFLPEKKLSVLRSVVDGGVIAVAPQRVLIMITKPFSFHNS